MTWIALLLWSVAAWCCPFCNPDVVAKQFVHETEKTVTLYCLTPATKGNLLVIPKRHIERFEDLSAEEMLEIQSEIRLFSSVFKDLYGISDYVIVEKNGSMAGQSVAHIHFHLIPCPKPFHEIVTDAFLFRAKISDKEMKERTTELRNFLTPAKS